MCFFWGCIVVLFFDLLLSAFLVFARETLFSYGFSIISLGFAWFLLGKTLFLYGICVISLGFLFFVSYSFRVISLVFFGFFVGKTLFSYGLRVISLGFQKENIRYLGYFSGKSDFPDSTIFLRVLCHFLRFCLVFPLENTISLRIPCHFLRFFWFFVGKTLFSYGFRVMSLGFLVFRTENTIFLRLPCHWLRFSEGEHKLPWLFFGKIRFS